MSISAGVVNWFQGECSVRNKQPKKWTAANDAQIGRIKQVMKFVTLNIDPRHKAQLTSFKPQDEVGGAAWETAAGVVGLAVSRTIQAAIEREEIQAFGGKKSTQAWTFSAFDNRLAKIKAKLSESNVTASWDSATGSI